MNEDPHPRANPVVRFLRHALRRGRESGGVAFTEFGLVAAAALIIIGAAFWAAFHFVRPAPPAAFVISTGSASGAYNGYARRYAQLLARDGLKVTPLASSGSAENVQRLADANSGVDVAFVQGGVGDAARQPDLVTLAALYYEPLWIFYRGKRELHLLSELRGRRVAIGPEGSGTRALALTLFAASGGAPGHGGALAMDGTEAADALVAGRIDAALFVAGADAPVVQRLLHARGVRLMSLAHAEAYARRLPYLSTVTLPRGGIDIARDQPPRTVTLLASTAYLVANQNFHPALIAVLLQAVSRVHRTGGVFHRPGEFPAARDGDYPLSEEARRYFTSGPPFLQRYLPFWVANLIQRLLVLLVPLVAVVIPVMRVFPGVYSWRVRRRVFLWYRALREVETEAAKDPSPAHARELLERLERIREGVGRTRVPIAYSDYTYNLKLHIDVVKSRLAPLAAGKSDGATQA